MVNGRYVPMHTQDREWDARFNLPNDEDVEALIAAATKECKANKLRYLLIGGVEIGTNQYQDDFAIRHVHMCLVYNNRATKSAILKNLEIKTGYGYYLVPRKRELPYSGWRSHHVKVETKVDPQNAVLYEYGQLPPDKESPTSTFVKRSDQEKKSTMNEIILQLRSMIEANQDKEAFDKYPRAYLQYGEKIKSLIGQTRDYFQTNGDPNLWVYGAPGTGKSAVLQLIYPKYYNKSLMNRFFDLFNPDVHTHILLSDVDHDAYKSLGAQFFKTICDEEGFPIDQKYKTPNRVHRPILVSSNFTIEDVIPEDMPGRNETLRAMKRRFFEVNIRDLLQLLGLRLITKYDQNLLKKQGNQDIRKIFIGYDSLRDVPTGLPLEDATVYQERIKDAYYAPKPAKRQRS